MQRERELAVLEQISMLLVASPVPPLGIRLKDGGETTTSHDLLATLLLAAMRRGRKDLDEQRETLQRQAMDHLLKRLEALLGSSGAEKDAYAAFQQYAGDYIHSFEGGDAAPDSFSFFSIEEEAPARVLAATRSWMAAQRILHERKAENRKTAADFEGLTYVELLQEHLRWVVSLGRVPID